MENWDEAVSQLSSCPLAKSDPIWKWLLESHTWEEEKKKELGSWSAYAVPGKLESGTFGEEWWSSALAPTIREGSHSHVTQ